MTITLPPAFTFSATGLQDFSDCPRRFQLRYLLEQDWPAPAAQPIGEAEQTVELGRRFHLLMQRYWLGLPVPHIDPALAPWWEAFQAHPPADLPGIARRPEVSATALVEGQRLTATFDLLAHAPDGEAAIVDWKTSRRPPRHILDRRLQTILYPLVLVEAAPRLLGHSLKPEAVRLIYWFAAPPDSGVVEVFRYSTARYEEDRRYLHALFQRLRSLTVDEWPLTANEKLCRLCQYRSLCNRGREAGAIADDVADTWPDVEELRGIIAEAAASDDFVL
jgi:CRISPR/Cas system-associated exonuclease Cas4 (RecB family)